MISQEEKNRGLREEKWGRHNYYYFFSSIIIASFELFWIYVMYHMSFETIVRVWKENTIINLVFYLLPLCLTILMIYKANVRIDNIEKMAINWEHANNLGRGGIKIVRIILIIAIFFWVLQIGIIYLAFDHMSSINGKSDSTIKNSDQIWMAENLNVSNFRNGDPIPEAKTDEEWYQAGKDGKPAWCYYDNDPVNEKKYGKLYNWYAVNDSRGLAPEGWHIPTEAELKTLSASVNGNGNSLKAIGEGTGDYAGTNTSGFSALLRGYRNGLGSFCNPTLTFFWSSSDYDVNSAHSLSLSSNDSKFWFQAFTMSFGFNVRCLKD